MSAGSITALPAHPPAFFVFIWAALTPYALHLALSPDADVARDGRASRCSTPRACPLSAGRFTARLRRAAELHLQNATLVHRLDDARQGLEATVATRTMELRATNAALLREVAERRRSEDRVRHLLAHDPLTNLPNRLLLVDRIEQALARSTRYGTRTAVVVFDIDRFKDVNDSFGHPAGDRLLRDLAERVRAAVRGSDTVARLGGDEFALVAPDLGDGAETDDRGAAPARCLPPALRPRRRPGAGHHQHRRRRFPRAWPGRRCPAARRGRRALSRQGCGQGSGGPLLAGPAFGAGVPPPAGGGAATCRRTRRVRPRLSAPVRSRHPPPDRRRGAAALAAPGVRRPAHRPVHRGRRGQRADRRHRPLGAGRRLRAGPALARCRPSRPDRGQSLRGRVPPSEPAAADRRRP